jgi:hypothetical protein
MSAQGWDDRIGNADDASTSLGLERLEEHFAGGPFDVRGPDPDRASRSRSRRRSAVTSPDRRLANVASSTRAQNRGPACSGRGRHRP